MEKIECNFISGFCGHSKEEAQEFLSSDYFLLPEEFWMAFDKTKQPPWFVATFVTRCPYCYVPNFFGTTGLWPNSASCSKCKKHYILSKQEN